MASEVKVEAKVDMSWCDEEPVVAPLELNIP